MSDETPEITAAESPLDEIDRQHAEANMLIEALHDMQIKLDMARAEAARLIIELARATQDRDDRAEYARALDQEFNDRLSEARDAISREYEHAPGALPEPVAWREQVIGGGCRYYGERPRQHDTAPTPGCLAAEPLFGEAAVRALAIESITNAGHVKLHRVEVARLTTALEKVNAIRESIIGTQTVNWSEHVYPLVAALDAAGFTGTPYPEARENFGTLIERAAKAEAEVARLTAENMRLGEEYDALDRETRNKIESLAHDHAKAVAERDELLRAY